MRRFVISCCRRLALLLSAGSFASSVVVCADRRKLSPAGHRTFPQKSWDEAIVKYRKAWISHPTTRSPTTTWRSRSNTKATQASGRGISRPRCASNQTGPTRTTGWVRLISICTTSQPRSRNYAPPSQFDPANVAGASPAGAHLRAAERFFGGCESGAAAGAGRSSPRPNCTSNWGLVEGQLGNLDAAAAQFRTRHSH